jgi:hypothetical protein
MRPAFDAGLEARLLHFPIVLQQLAVGADEIAELAAAGRALVQTALGTSLGAGLAAGCAAGEFTTMGADEDVSLTDGCSFALAACRCTSSLALAATG